MGLYERQLAALDKRRGKGSQKITVEHVNVYGGGQAIVGDVNTGQAPLPSPTASERGAALPDDSSASSDGEDLKRALDAKEPSLRARKRK